MIKNKIKELGLEISDLEVYSMTPINFGMQVDNQIRPIYIKHIPTGEVVIEDNNRNHHKNLMNGLEKIKQKIRKES